jgi:hypothetical protein
MVINPIKIAETIIDNGVLEKVLVAKGIYDCCVLHINKQIISFRYDYSMEPRIERFMIFIDGDDINVTTEENIMIRHLLISKWDSKAWALIAPIERMNVKTKQR